MRVLVPLTISDSMVTTHPVAEPSGSEAAWVSAAAVTLGDVKIRATTHRKYQCLITHTGRTVLPENDPDYWEDIGPTDRWAQFDAGGSAQTATTTTMTTVVRPGFMNAICLYRLTGSNISVTVKDAPAGATIYSYSGALDGPYIDWYEWLFDPYRSITKLVCDEITPYPDPEVTIVITGSGTVGCGGLLIGDLRTLVSSDNAGGTQYGARAKPVDNSYVKINDYGNTLVKRRPTGTDMDATVWLEQEDADYALSVIQAVIGVPTAFIATTHSGYDGLNVCGLVNAEQSYASSGHVLLDINVKGTL